MADDKQDVTVIDISGDDPEVIGRTTSDPGEPSDLVEDIDDGSGSGDSDIKNRRRLDLPEREPSVDPDLVEEAKEQGVAVPEDTTQADIGGGGGGPTRTVEVNVDEGTRTVQEGGEDVGSFQEVTEDVDRRRKNNRVDKPLKESFRQPGKQPGPTASRRELAAVRRRREEGSGFERAVRGTQDFLRLDTEPRQFPEGPLIRGGIQLMQSGQDVGREFADFYPNFGEIVLTEAGEATGIEELEQAGEASGQFTESVQRGAGTLGTQVTGLGLTAAGGAIELGKRGTIGGEPEKAGGFLLSGTREFAGKTVEEASEDPVEFVGEESGEEISETAIGLLVGGPIGGALGAAPTPEIEPSVARDIGVTEQPFQNVESTSGTRILQEEFTRAEEAEGSPLETVPRRTGEPLQRRGGEDVVPQFRERDPGTPFETTEGFTPTEVEVLEQRTGGEVTGFERGPEGTIQQATIETPGGQERQVSVAAPREVGGFSETTLDSLGLRRIGLAGGDIDTVPQVEETGGPTRIQPDDPTLSESFGRDIDTKTRDIESQLIGDRQQTGPRPEFETETETTPDLDVTPRPIIEPDLGQQQGQDFGQVEVTDMTQEPQLEPQPEPEPEPEFVPEPTPEPGPEPEFFPEPEPELEFVPERTLEARPEEEDDNGDETLALLTPEKGFDIDRSVAADILGLKGETTAEEAEAQAQETGFTTAQNPLSLRAFSDENGQL